MAQTKAQEAAIKAFTPDPDYIEPFMNQIWGPTIGAIFGFTGVCVGSFMMRRPVFSGIQRHILAAVGGAGLGKWLEGNRIQYYAERDAVYRHYIQLHPEDFPEIERKKWADVLIPWVPIR